MTTAPGKTTVPILVYGALGRMGSRVIDLATKTPGFEVVGGVDSRAGAAVQDPRVNVHERVPSDLPEGTVVIDFSLAGAVGPLVEAIAPLGRALVSGTTGLGEKEVDTLRAYSEVAPVLYDTNMSYGISVMKEILGVAARLLKDGTETEIVEFHHSGKRDYPSGTAFALAAVIDPDAAVVAGREADSSGSKAAIPVHSGRVGGLPGEHRVVFASDEEMITIEHRAITRDVFARGALRAARFVSAQPSGFYSMKDLLEAQNE
ncbi:MAG: 4-hydroxy-tetrahydrodipicolinate reductase [Candidatus Latescibacterota bacterium]|nr:MAG: 4-hydroxy-tetrahydrodipicolinate reductase [Candidatus Latescibacterota bacterium]